MISQRLLSLKWAKPVVKITKQGLKIISKNSNLILTIVGATGAIASVALAIKGTIKAVKLCEEKKVVGAKEVVKTVWKCYIPTVGMVLLTTTAIVSNGRINAKRIAVLASALTSSKEAMKLMENKMSEMVGPKKAQAVIDEVHSESAQKSLNNNNPDIIDTGYGDELFFLEDIGQWLQTSTNKIELAEYKTAESLEDSNDWDSDGDNYIMMNVALEHLHARPCYYGSSHGWSKSSLNAIGLKGPKFRISSKRMDVNGVNRAVGTVWFEPEPELI